MYTDSGDVVRYNSKIKDNKLFFNKGEWVIQQSDSSSLYITTDSRDTIRLYKLESLGRELIQFYDWANAKHRNGNGYMMLWRDATDRKMRLLQTLKKNL